MRAPGQSAGATCAPAGATMAAASTPDTPSIPNKPSVIAFISASCAVARFAGLPSLYSGSGPYWKANSSHRISCPRYCAGKLYRPFRLCQSLRPRRLFMSSVVIVSAARTAIGTARKGSLANTTPEAMAAVVVRAAIERSGFAPDRVDDVVLAESLAGGGAIARHAAVELGITRAAGMAINRHCAGGLSALGIAAGATPGG